MNINPGEEVLSLQAPFDPDHAVAASHPDSPEQLTFATREETIHQQDYSPEHPTQHNMEDTNSLGSEASAPSEEDELQIEEWRAELEENHQQEFIASLQSTKTLPEGMRSIPPFGGDYGIIPDEGAEHQNSESILDDRGDRRDPIQLYENRHSGIFAYAELRFPDGYFYITTRSIILGRDVEGAAMALWNENPRDSPLPPQVGLSEQGGAHRSEPEGSYIDTNLAEGDCCPVIRIHPPQGSGSQAYQQISRKHAKISFDTKNNCWYVRVLGRNGLFVRKPDPPATDQHLKKGTCCVLEDEYVIQIGRIAFQFRLPDSNVGQGDTLSQDISHDFEPPGSDDPMSDTSDEDELEVESDDEVDNIECIIEEHLKSVPTREAAEEENGGDLPCQDEVVKGTTSEPEPQPQKKRGPGRPPKNGVMSKREQREAKKAAEQKAKQADVESSSKAGDLEKNSGEVAPPAKLEKRKYTKRKPKEEAGGEDQPSKAKTEKKKKDPEPEVRSPSPEITDYTEEQLAKPAKSYLALIYEVLSAADKPMDLPKIYRAIQRLCPYYRFSTTTTGWQSSVRHNMGHPAFRKVDKKGKGHDWEIVPGVTIEKDRKVRPVEPPREAVQYQQPIYQAGQQPPHMTQGPPGSTPGSVPFLGYNLDITRGPYPASFYEGLYSAQVRLQRPGVPYSSPYPATNPPVAPSQQQITHQEMQHAAHVNGTAPQYAHQPFHVPQLDQQPTQRADSTFTEAIEKFRTVLLSQLKIQQPPVNQPEIIIQSAIDRVQGRKSSPAFENQHEDDIIEALKGVLAKMSGSQQNSIVQPPGSAPVPLHTHGSHLSAPATKASTPVTTIARPTLGTPGRANTAQRPVMMPRAATGAHFASAANTHLPQKPLMMMPEFHPNSPGLTHPEPQLLVMRGGGAGSPGHVPHPQEQPQSELFRPTPYQTSVSKTQAGVTIKPDPKPMYQEEARVKSENEQIPGSKRRLADGEDEIVNKRQRSETNSSTPPKKE